MNELLLSEITSENQSLLKTFSLLESFIFSSTEHNLSSLTTNTMYLEGMVLACQDLISDIENPLEQVESLINMLFIDNMLIDNPKALWPSIAFKIEDGLGYKLISPILKAVLIRHVFEQCDFDADIVFIPEKVMVRVSCDDVYAIIFDPISGESIDGMQLDARLDDLEGDPLNAELNSMSHDTLIVEHITALKNTLMHEMKFDQALKCVDILLGLRPDDPFERRDRGFLLHQLDCFKVAYDDYQYFVDKCPKDPAAQLLKLQLENITVTDSVLH